MIKIVILGTESTGKTILAKKLKDHYNASVVYETARNIVGKTDECTYNDLLNIKYAHAKAIEAEINNCNDLLIIDTDINITCSYSRFLFGRNIPVESKILEINKADIYLYLDKNVPYINDGTRLDEKYRNDLDLMHKIILNERNIEYFLIKSKNYKKRFNKSVKIIDNYLNNKNY